MTRFRTDRSSATHTRNAIDATTQLCEHDPEDVVTNNPAYDDSLVVTTHCHNRLGLLMALHMFVPAKLNFVKV